MTERARKVLDKAERLGVAAEWVGPTVRVRGRTMTVANAEAWLEGYEAGYFESPGRL